MRLLAVIFGSIGPQRSKDEGCRAEV